MIMLYSIVFFIYLFHASAHFGFSLAYEPSRYSGSREIHQVGKAFYVLDIYHELVEKEDMR